MTKLLNQRSNLSFHSSEQTLVTKLKDRLKEAGYTSEMYDERIQINTIDTYILGAKVVVCCINTHYIQSENYSKEFHLILNMKKPLIILYTEEQAWPPHEIKNFEPVDMLVCTSSS